METVTFTYFEAKCEYNFKTKNLHIISKHSFNSPNQSPKNLISKKHNIEKKDIKTITFKYPNTKLPSHLYYYFANYQNLEHIELEKLDFENVETINEFIANCPKLKEITITHKDAKNLTSIQSLITYTKNTKTITIKHINIPNLKEIKWLLWYIRENIEKITIEDITAPNIDTVYDLIHMSSLKKLDLTKIGNVSAQSIPTLISNCDKLKSLKINPLTNTKEIEMFLKGVPILETEIISKINKIKTLDTHFLRRTQKNEILDLDKFENINELTPHLKRNTEDNINKPQYTGIKIGKHKIKLIDYATILTYNIPIRDKTEKEIIKEIIKQSKNENKKDIELFLKVLKNEKYKNKVAPKLTVIKKLK